MAKRIVKVIGLDIEGIKITAEFPTFKKADEWLARNPLEIISATIERRGKREKPQC